MVNVLVRIYGKFIDRKMIKYIYKEFNASFVEYKYTSYTKVSLERSLVISLKRTLISNLRTYRNFFSCLLITSPCARTNFNSSSVLDGCFSFCSAFNRFGWIVFQAPLSDHVLESDLYLDRLDNVVLSFFILLNEIFT